ncbi:hypothetical protein BDZ91DRAFT_740160 [Kalaharituber pfeilii]|nr:hypothetical protein BDZ91DRAFT_740160 [Kalaharituber pfeilii]
MGGRGSGNGGIGEEDWSGDARSKGNGKCGLVLLLVAVAVMRHSSYPSTLLSAYEMRGWEKRRVGEVTVVRMK